MLEQKQHKVSRIKGDMLAPNFCFKTCAYGQAKPSINYYPFGSSMVSYKNEEFCFAFGFNGMEKDDEVKGAGNSLDFGARIYDSRLGRWLSVDLMAFVQPSWSTYKSFNDNPIIYIDPDGKLEKITTITYDPKTKTQSIEVTYSDKVMTDGIVHKVWTGSSGYYNVNNYYDFNTVVRKEVVNGKAIVKKTDSKIVKSNSAVREKTVWFTSEEKGHTISKTTWIDKLFNFVKEFSSYGITVYGSGKDVEYRRNGMPIGSLDLKELEELLGVLMARSGGKTPLTPTLPDMTSQLKEAIKTEIEKKKEEEEKKKAAEEKEAAPSSDSSECVRCGKIISNETLRGQGDADFKHSDENKKPSPKQ